MLATYGSFALILAASCVIGQALFALCGARRWSWLAPAVGLALVTAVAWGAVRLPGEGTAAAIAIGVLGAVALACVAGRTARPTGGIEAGVAVAVLVALAASIPFFVEGRFGILGTGLNPDMSQHLFAADRLAHGEGGRLVSQGYPLGPHALVVAASTVIGGGLVHGFDGLMLAIAVCAALAPMGLVDELAPWRRVACGALVALAYLVSSYLIQGAFKETMEALYVLAFAVGLHEAGRAALVPGSRAGGPRRALAAVPLAALAVGSAYAYSFPGLLWLAGAAAVWVAVELAIVARGASARAALAMSRAAAPAVAVALAVVCVACAPEVGRMVDFASFETFDPSGAGLGNLFNPISPLEALGIWPSGDFRLDPGDGAVPAVGFYLGELLGLVALAHGLVWWLWRRERAVPAALAVAAALYAYAHFAGTPYQAAKSIVIAAPLAMLIAGRALISGGAAIPLRGLTGAVARRRGGLVGTWARWEPRLRLVLATAFLGAAAGCSVLALANGPVGPAAYSPELTELRGALGDGSTLVLVPEHVLADAHGRDFVVWELRGGRVCVDSLRAPSASPPPRGLAHVITQGSAAAPYRGLSLELNAWPYTLWRVHPPPEGNGPCPLISVGGRANPASD
ncbi:MAG TPA: hypothetical protein VH391_08215 [Solirubrobacterales bacterium]|jgi:hypothetical protein